MSNPFAVLKAEEVQEKPMVKQERTVKRDYPTRGGKKGVSLGAVAKSNKREFDRHSGMDRKDSKKKDVAGKGTWGDAAEVPVVPVSESEASVEEEPLAPTRTLDEFLAEKTDKVFKTGVDTVPEPRKAVTGNWSNAKELKKEEDPEMLALMEGKKKAKKQKEKKQTEKTFLDIQQRLVVPEEDRERPLRGSSRGRGRDGRGRGGRGADRGRGGRGDKPRGRGRGLKLANEKEFPSL